MSVVISLLLLQAATVPPEPAKPTQSNKVVCKIVQGTGSRLNSERVCMTKRDWEHLHASGQQATKEMQNVPRVNKPF